MESDKRLKIKNIQNNNALSMSEKSKEIQKIMSGNCTINDINIINCNHYLNKKCNKFYFSCCNTFACCVRCHNENMINNHKAELKYITCKKCKLLQIPSNLCIDTNCNTVFSNNYCSKCFIWTDKSIVHCDDCGICRIGDKNSLFHCNNCDACFSIDGKHLHKCVNISYREQICAYCMESTHTSQDSSVSLKCGHLVHNKCLQSATKLHMYTCPSCRKSIYDLDWTSLKNLIEMQPMIEEDIYIEDIVECKVLGNLSFQVNDISINTYGFKMYKGIFIMNDIKYGSFNRESLKKPLKRVDIYCNDCDTKSNVLFHYLGHECLNCSSFNTSL